MFKIIIGSVVSIVKKQNYETDLVCLVIKNGNDIQEIICFKEQANVVLNNIKPDDKVCIEANVKLLNNNNLVYIAKRVVFLHKTASTEK